MSHPSRTVAALASAKNQPFIDPEFGEIAYRRLAGARYVRVRIDKDGQLRATLPAHAPLSSLAGLIDNSRKELRGYTEKITSTLYHDNQQIGQSHRLRIVTSLGNLRATIQGQTIMVGLPRNGEAASTRVQSLIRTHVVKALRIEAKAYLPRRLHYLAEQYGFRYEKVRFANQSSRWGSCSSNGTISLNIALMNIPFELIDYVLVHELAHTQQMNHSPAFWNIVQAIIPQYKNSRKRLKTHTPFI